MAGTFESVSAGVAGIVSRGIVPVSIVGDCYFSFPILRGLARSLGVGAALSISTRPMPG